MGIRKQEEQSLRTVKQSELIDKLSPNLGLSRGKYLRYPVANFSRLIKSVEASLSVEGQVNLLYFWGVGVKRIPDKYDIEGMTMLEAIRQRLELTFNKPSKLTLLLSDLHGMANEFPSDQIDAYLNEIKKWAISYQMNPIFLSSVFSEEEIKSLYEPSGVQEFEVFTANYHQLEMGASKTGSLQSIPHRALRYLLVRLRERPKIQTLFPNHILLNGDRRENEFLQVELPMIYIFNTGFKKSHKAWFLAETLTDI